MAIKGLMWLSHFFLEIWILSFNPAQFNFIPNPNAKMEFYPIIRAKIEFHPFIRKERYPLTSDPESLQNFMIWKLFSINQFWSTSKPWTFEAIPNHLVAFVV